MNLIEELDAEIAPPCVFLPGQKDLMVRSRDMLSKIKNIISHPAIPIDQVRERVEAIIEEEEYGDPR